VKFQVINEAEEGASALRMKVVRRLSHDPSTRELRYELSGCSPGIGRSYSKLKRGNLVRAVARVAGNAVRRGPAGSETGIGDSEVRGAFASTGKKRHRGNE
jgi:hypothetical protein